MVILITGGSGLIGKALSTKLAEAGNEVRVLTRKKIENSKINYFQWDLKNQFIESKATENVDVLIHLAGENIAEKPWSKARIEALIKSRTETLEFLQNKIPTLKKIVSGSAIGYYGAECGENVCKIDSPVGKDVLSEICLQWENTALKYANDAKIPFTIVRTGLVLSKVGGVFPKLKKLSDYYIGSALGNGNQWMSWIHIDDLVEIFFQALSDLPSSQIINGVAPFPVRANDFMKVLNHKNHKICLAPNVPSFILKLTIGSRASLVLGSCYAEASDEIKYKFSKIETAIENLI